jgi:sulfur-carrier protein
MIKVLFFAGIREEMGRSELEMVEKENITVYELKEYFQKKYSLSSFNHPIMTAINEVFVTDDEIIKDQDIIAFIPPVSGG